MFVVEEYEAFAFRARFARRFKPREDDLTAIERDVPLVTKSGSFLAQAYVHLRLRCSGNNLRDLVPAYANNPG